MTKRIQKMLFLAISLNGVGWFDKKENNASTEQGLVWKRSIKTIYLIKLRMGSV